MHTPEEAKLLWCPMARVAQAGNIDISSAYNRTLTKLLHPMRSVKADPDSFKLGEEPEETTVMVLNTQPATSMAANCLGDKCAMWRWVPGGQKNSGGARHPTTHGYCGLSPLHSSPAS